MRRVAAALAVIVVAGWFLWTKFQPPPPRLAGALAKAKAEKKLVLLDFTGSDWCGWCMKLDEEALGKPEFLDYAANNLVTLVVDFPRTHEIDADLRKGNKAMYNKYGVSGFPTLLALSPDGKVVWRQPGYIPGGPFAVIAPLNRSRLALGFPGLPTASRQAANVAAAATPIATTEKVVPLPVPPTAPAQHGLPSKAPKLQGIVYSKKNPSAIIEGKECEEGESVRGMRVVKIMPNKVVVEWEGRTEELTMN